MYKKFNAKFSYKCIKQDGAVICTKHQSMIKNQQHRNYI